MCHGPAGDHALPDADPRPAMPVNGELLAKPHVLCMGCHAQTPGREPTVRQIDYEKHLAEWKVKKDELDEYEEGRQCLGCHPPHRPKKQ